MRLIIMLLALVTLAQPAAAQMRLPQGDPSILRDAPRANEPPPPEPPRDPQTPQIPAEADRARLAPGIVRQNLCDVVAWERALRPLSATSFPCLDWRAEVSWVRADGVREIYAQWPQDRRDRLDALFMALLTDAPDLGVACPPSPVTTAAGLTETQALDIYLVHVAHALMLERERLVPARLHRLPRAERAAILAPEFYVTRLREADGRVSSYTLVGMDFSARAFDCDPRVGFRFMQNANLVGATDLETLRNLTTWFRTELAHGGYSERQRAEHAHLEQRLTRYRGYTEELTAYWAVNGCHDAAPLFADLARAVNIPVMRAYASDAPGSGGDHAGLVYGWAGPSPRIVPHVDALYAQDWIIFPIDAAGARLSPAAREQAFFDAAWRTPNALAARGFDYNLRRFTRAELGPFALPFDDNAWVSGAWRANPGVRSPELVDLLVRGYAVGGVQIIAQRCPNGPWSAEMWDDYISGTAGRPIAELTGAQLRDRVEQIVSAYGGCEAIGAEMTRAEDYKRRPL